MQTSPINNNNNNIVHFIAFTRPYNYDKLAVGQIGEQEIDNSNFPPCKHYPFGQLSTVLPRFIGRIAELEIEIQRKMCDDFLH
jgi:hypothetical protein